MPKQRAQRGDPAVAGIWHYRLHGPPAAGHLPTIDRWASPSMDAALAKGALESLPEYAAGLVAGSKPKLFRASALVAAGDPERRRRPALNDAPHRILQQTKKAPSSRDSLIQQSGMTLNPTSRQCASQSKVHSSGRSRQRALAAQLSRVAFIYVGGNHLSCAPKQRAAEV